MEKIMKIEIVLGDSKVVWAEIAPSTIPLRHKEDNIRTTARKMWQEARESRSLVDVHGGYKFCSVTITTKTCFGESKQTFAV